jgi:Zn-dependent protease
MNQDRPESALERLRRLEVSRGVSATSTGAPSVPAPQRRRGFWGTLTAGAALAFGKLKFLLAGLKFLSLGKLLTTSSTMLLSLLVYAQFYGWRFAAGFLLLILVHELGHGLAASIQGLKVGAPVFIPFFGAFIALKELPKTAYQDFFIGAGGPLAGSAGGVGCILLAPYIGGVWSGLFYAVGYFALWLNLFNLFPVWSLDGARMTAPLSANGWRAGFAFLALVTLYAVSGHGHLQPMPLILLAVVGFRALRSFGRSASAVAPTDDSAMARLQAANARAQATRDSLVTAEQRVIATCVYFGLAATLVYLVHALSAGLPPRPR